MRLIQHDYIDDPWRMMVACVLSNRRHSDHVRPVLDELFSRWPTPLDIIEASSGDLEAVITPMGLSKTRAVRLTRMTQDALQGKVVGGWFGVGRYAVESWMIFVAGAIIWPDDKELRSYLEWCASRGERPPAYSLTDDLERGPVTRPEPLRIMRFA